MTNPAWSQVDNQHIFWELALGGGEIGDMCAQDPASFVKFQPFNYVVQRVWSNAAAMAGNDPCVPDLPADVYFNGSNEMEGAETYFNAAPVLPDTINLGQFQFVGINIPVGQTKPVTLDLFSTASTDGPFRVDVWDFNALMGGTAMLDFTMKNGDVGMNGDQLTVDVDVLSASQYNAEIFMVMACQPVSSPCNPGVSTWWHSWIGVVGN